ncbi:hypothetical protein OPIT5_00285 (plasmid) [Opitutaceae bacterium TAV5]|nr:hypothetical protein OPIT5_00285 [Opitutaceae bacterium TAV5]
MNCIFKTVTVLVFVILAGAGCSSTHKRSAIVTGSTLAGAGAGYAIGGEKHRAAGTLIGAGAGALGSMLVLGEDGEVYRRGLDEGYILGSSDAVKRLYWSKQALEKPTGQSEGVLRYYSWEEEGTTADGRKLAPETVAVPIYEPVRQP